MKDFKDFGINAETVVEDTHAEINKIRRGLDDELTPEAMAELSRAIEQRFNTILDESVVADVFERNVEETLAASLRVAQSIAEASRDMEAYKAKADKFNHAFYTTRYTHTHSLSGVSPILAAVMETLNTKQYVQFVTMSYIAALHLSDYGLPIAE